MTEQPVGFSATPETRDKILLKHTEIMEILAQATEEIFADMPPDIRERDLRPVIYKTQVFDFVNLMTSSTQKVYVGYIKEAQLRP